MSALRLSPAAIAGSCRSCLAAPGPLLFPASEKYYLHLLIQILLWAFIYTGWSLMGRFGLTSLGHGAFTGIGAYGTVLLWNYVGLTPWLGIPVAIAVAAIVGVLVGYPCFRFRITGHYFALLTLALTEFVRLCIVGLRDYTGGSLGTQPGALRRRHLALCHAVRARPHAGLLHRVRALAVRALHVAAGSIAAWTAMRSTRRARTRMRRPASAST